MKSKHQRQVRTCACGKEFRVSVRFGNERKCDGCYEARSAAFLDEFSRMSLFQQEEVLAITERFLADLEQKEIDTAFRTIMEDIEL